MAEDEKLGFLDHVVRLLANAMTAVGLNGTRLQWKWNQKRTQLAEDGLKREMLWRSARGRHKMCPSCRSLVDRSEKSCPECGTSLHAVKAPGLSRSLTNFFPGIGTATSLLMLVNGFWFVMMLMAQTKSGAPGGGSLFSSFNLELMVRFGAGMSEPRIMPTGELAGGEWWRLITPIFLHGGLLHFFFNSYLLLYLGPIAEEVYGTSRFWVIYLTCGIAGSMASQWTRFTITVGASGAIAGLMGLLVVYGIRHGGVLGQSMKSLALRIAIYSVVLSLFMNIDHLNHIGGFACGGLLALVLPGGAYKDGRERAVWQVLAAAGVLLVLFAFFKVAMAGRAAGA